MDEKIDKTVNKTIEALSRIERFIEKYKDKLNKDQIKKISSKLVTVLDTIKE